MQPFSEEIKHFLETTIDSVEQLEIVRILASDQSKELSAGELARTVQTSSRKILQHVAALERRGLLGVRCESRFLVRYAPATPQIDELVNCLLASYNERPVTMIRMLYGKSHTTEAET
jgi:hypothetical protein